MQCKHVNAQELQAPRPSQTVYRDDCTQCFDSIDNPTGLDVCLYCFNGGCTGDRKHAQLHYEASMHPLVLNIKRTKKKRERTDDEERPHKISKLSIAAETEADYYDTATRVICFACNIDDVDKSSGRIPSVVDGVMNANTFARQAQVDAWELEIKPCNHTIGLVQESSRRIPTQEDLEQCSSCELKTNLWLCLQCGNVGCGRSQFGGVGGNGHGLAHTDTAHHPVAVKLGSITPEGAADIYCYSCNDERVDPNLAAHLAHWGIDIAGREKTEKSMTELQIDQNLSWEFSMTTEDGKELKPLYGKGLTGFKNLGNSCYLASILQCLFALPVFKDRYYRPSDTLPSSQNPAKDLETQLRKLADGLLSGRYSNKDPDVTASADSAEVPHQKGLAPAMFKHLIGQGHEEFSTMRQQDAFELLQHLFKLINRSRHPFPLDDPIRAFKFVVEQRLQCVNCRKVRYKCNEQENISITLPRRKMLGKPQGQESLDTKKTGEKEEYGSVALTECLDIFTNDEQVEFTCSSCGSKDGFSKSTKFKTFPEVLAVNVSRFMSEGGVQRKVDVPVIVGDAPFALDSYKSLGHQSDEELLPEDVSTGSAQVFIPNEAALSMLLEIGTSYVRATRALHATGNSNAEDAMNWLFSHENDPDIDTPLDLGQSEGSATTAPDSQSLATVVEMGIPAPQAKKALKETGGDIERAIDWYYSHMDDPGEPEDEQHDVGERIGHQENEETGFPGSDELPAHFQLASIVCHKGSSVHAGHYVAFIRKEVPDDSDAWVLFNDEKVVKAVDADDMKKSAYLYFFRRV